MGCVWFDGLNWVLDKWLNVGNWRVDRRIGMILVDCEGEVFVFMMDEGENRWNMIFVRVFD